MALNTFPCNPYPISTEELNKGNNDDLNTRVAALESDVSDLNSNKANQITIAPFFNAEVSYSVGDLIYYNGLTYRCTNDHEGAWDADDFAATTIANELDTLKSGLMAYPLEAQKNSNYVGDNNVNIIKIGHMVNISGRFQVSTEKPSGQENYLFTVPKPVGIIIPVYNAGTDNFIINQNGYLTANGVITTGYYNVNVTYSTTE